MRFEQLVGQTLLDETIVFTMVANPNPYITHAIIYRKSAIASANTSGPKLSDLFEFKRWMSWVFLEQFEILPRKPLNRGR